MPLSAPVQAPPVAPWILLIVGAGAVLALVGVLVFVLVFSRVTSGPSAPEIILEYAHGEHGDVLKSARKWQKPKGLRASAIECEARDKRSWKCVVFKPEETPHFYIGKSNRSVVLGFKRAPVYQVIGGPLDDVIILREPTFLVFLTMSFMEKSYRWQDVGQWVKDKTTPD